MSNTNLQNRIIQTSGVYSELKVLKLPWLGLWRAQDYLKAVQDQCMTLMYQLIYTDTELREIIRKCRVLGHKFKNIDHFRTYLFLELCKKLPEPVYCQVFKHFHVIVPATDLAKSPPEEIQIATMIPEQYQNCPLTPEILMALE